MGLKGKLVDDIEVCSAEQYFELLCHGPQRFSEFADHVQDCELLGGKRGHNGSIIQWHYTQSDGRVCKAKEIFEVDEKNKSMRFTVIGGDPTEDYKSMVIDIHTTSAKSGSDLVKLITNYETLHENGPPPFLLGDVIVKATKDFKVENYQAALFKKYIISRILRMGSRCMQYLKSSN